MSERSGKPRPMSRRQFVTLVAAGSAALIAPAAGAAPAPAPRKRRAGGGAGPRTASAATERELARQRASTLETLKTIRGHAMPPGTELGFVFRAVRPTRREI